MALENEGMNWFPLPRRKFSCGKILVVTGFFLLLPTLFWGGISANDFVSVWETMGIPVQEEGNWRTVSLPATDSQLCSVSLETGEFIVFSRFSRQLGLVSCQEYLDQLGTVLQSCGMEARFVAQFLDWNRVADPSAPCAQLEGFSMQAMMEPSTGQDAPPPFGLSFSWQINRVDATTLALRVWPAEQAPSAAANGDVTPSSQGSEGDPAQPAPGQELQLLRNDVLFLEKKVAQLEEKNNSLSFLVSFFQEALQTQQMVAERFQTLWEESAEREPELHEELGQALQKNASLQRQMEELAQANQVLQQAFEEALRQKGEALQAQKAFYDGLIESLEIQNQALREKSNRQAQEIDSLRVLVTQPLVVPAVVAPLPTQTAMQSTEMQRSEPQKDLATPLPEPPKSRVSLVSFYEHQSGDALFLEQNEYAAEPAGGSEPATTTVFTPSGEEFSRTIRQFDANGNVVLSESWRGEERVERVENRYDAQGKLQESLLTTAGEKAVQRVFRYTAEGELEEVQVIQPDGETLREVYFFDFEHKLTEIRTLDAKGLVLSRVLQEYDSDGKLVRVKFYEKFNLVGYHVHSYAQNGHISRTEYYNGEGECVSFSITTRDF